ncbi:MAG: sensor histidine kinase [Sphaerochaetaceae bacterium]|nr:sensor histidine kinase [Sphaerochaetaceae bacterium]
MKCEQFIASLRHSLQSPLQKRIFLYITSFSFIITLVGFILVAQFFFLHYIPAERDHALKSSHKAKQSIEFLLSIADNTALLLSTNQAIISGLRADEYEAGKSEGEWKNEIDRMLQNMIVSHEYIDNIYVIGTDGEFFTSYWDTTRAEVEERFKDEVERLSLSEGFDTRQRAANYIPFFDLNVISYTRPIYQYSGSEPEGLLVFDLNYTYLREIFTFSSIQPDNEDEKVLIVDGSGESIFTFPFNTDFDFLLDTYPELAEGGAVVEGEIFGIDSFILSSTINYSDWIIIRIISKEQINTTVTYMSRTGVSILIVFIVVAAIISFVLSLSITTPIINLHDTIWKVEKGNLNVRASGEGRDEIGQLATSFNHMIEQLSSLMERTLNEQKQKSDLEFQILQSQINPHFLYNTLDSIKWLAVFQNVENISDMVTSLINLLKYNISRNSKLVELKDELKCIEDYTEIQKFRFGDEFQLIYDIEPGTENKFILKFILQPLVENAIFHGFDTIDYIGVITVRSRTKGEFLILEIEDNGKGLDLDSEDTSSAPQAKKKTMHSSIGIKNVRDRLRLYFGEKGSLSLLNNPHKKGSMVQIILPALDHEIQFPELGKDILNSLEGQGNG